MDRCQGGGLAPAPVFNCAVLFATAFIPFVPLYVTADHFCVEAVRSAQPQWFVLFLVIAGRPLHQRGRAVCLKALLEAKFWKNVLNVL